jgi:hypothetical protein
MGRFSTKKPTGDSASSFMCGKYRQLYHHISGELSTLKRYRSSVGMKKILLLPNCPVISREYDGWNCISW